VTVHFAVADVGELTGALEVLVDAVTETIGWTGVASFLFEWDGRELQVYTGPDTGRLALRPRMWGGEVSDGAWWKSYAMGFDRKDQGKLLGYHHGLRAQLASCDDEDLLNGDDLALFWPGDTEVDSPSELDTELFRRDALHRAHLPAASQGLTMKEDR